ncbi:GIY-YIG nuclease family protein [Lysobacter sp. GCM10012299]|uniref:GIY-YIG nuclease family protein n=1 Tax=Lysobacter sp. GCM10012299 TaxID=3317333 RepID=UPI003617CF0D
MALIRTADPDRTRASSEGASYLYVLPCAGEDLLKLGFSRHPLQRMQALHTRYFEFFDLDRAFLVETETVRDARDLELALGHAIALHSAPMPLLVREAAGGHSEWYRGAGEVLASEISALAVRGYTVHDPLRPWLRRELLRGREDLFTWASTLLDGLAGEPEWLDQPQTAALRQHALDTLDAYAAVDIPVADVLPDLLARWYRDATGNAGRGG